MSFPFLKSLAAAIAGSNVSGGFANTFGNRVYLDKAPADSPLPLCVYRVDTVRNIQTVDGRELVMRVVFSMFANADDTGDLEVAQGRLKTLLGGKFAATGYDRMATKLLQQGVPTLDDEAWLVEDEYELRGTSA